MAEKPPLLLRTDPGEERHGIRLRMSFDEDLEDRQLTEPAVIAHGPLRLSPCYDFEKIPFFDTIKSRLHILNYTSIYKIQRYCWRAVLRGDNVIVISNQGTGKTLGYVPCIGNFVLSPHPDLPDGKGPIVIILCPSVKIVEKVNTLLQHIMVEHPEINILKVVHIYDEVWYELKRGIDVLITIPILLVRMLNNDMINLHRLCNVIVDEASDAYSREIEINWLLQTFHEELENRNVYMPIQLILFSQAWTKPIEALAFTLKLPPFICIGSYMEAAIYGEAELNIYMSTEVTKNIKLIRLIKNKSTVRKTLIIYNDSESPSNLLKFLEVYGFTFIHCSKDNIKLVLSQKVCWYNAKRGQYFVLVCSDECFKTGPPIHDAEIIIQYSLPETWSELDFRFSGFIHKYSSPLLPNPSTPEKCTMEILVTKKNWHLLPRLVNFAQRMGTKLSDNLLDHNKTSSLAIEFDKLKLYRPICHELLSLGSCNISIKCPLRHIFSPDRDYAPLLPKYGLIKFKLLEAKSPGHYYVRLIEWTNHTGWKLDLDLKTKVRAMIAQSYKMRPLTINVGSSYLLEIDDTFQRCKVMNLIKKNGSESYFVHGFDTGLNYIVSQYQLFMLNEDLREMPHQAVLIYIANIKPRDRQVTWPSPCLDILNNEFEKAGYRKPNYYFASRILLQIGDVLLVDDLKLIEKKVDGTFVKRMSVCDTLEKLDCAEKHPDHLKPLYTLCEKFKIPDTIYYLPPDENYSSPVEEEDEEENDSLPVEEKNEEENYRLSVEEENYSLPVEEEDEEENFSLDMSFWTDISREGDDDEENNRFSSSSEEEVEEENNRFSSSSEEEDEEESYRLSGEEEDEESSSSS